MNAVFIDFQQIQTDNVRGLVFSHDKMLMDCHGSQGKKIGSAQHISFIKRNLIHLVIQTKYLPFIQVQSVSNNEEEAP